MIRGGGGSKEGRKHICKITWREKEDAAEKKGVKKTYRKNEVKKIYT